MVKKLVRFFFVVGFGCCLINGNVRAVNTAQLRIKANVAQEIGIQRIGDGDIDLFGDQNIATIKAMANVAIKIILTSLNGFKVKDGDKEISYKIFKEDEDLQANREFNVANNDEFHLKFESLTPKNRCSVGDYSDTVTVTVVAVEVAAGPPAFGGQPVRPYQQQ